MSALSDFPNPPSAEIRRALTQVRQHRRTTTKTHTPKILYTPVNKQSFINKQTNPPRTRRVVQGCTLVLVTGIGGCRLQIACNAIQQPRKTRRVAKPRRYVNGSHIALVPLNATCHKACPASCHKACHNRNRASVSQAQSCNTLLQDPTMSMYDR